MFIVWEQPPPCIVCVRNYIIDTNIQSGQEVVDQTKLESFCSFVRKDKNDICSFWPPCISYSPTIEGVNQASRKLVKNKD